MSQEFIVKIIVVGSTQIDGEVGHADLADMHPARRIDYRSFDVALIERLLPILQRRNQKRRADARAPRLAVPAMVRQQRKIKHRLAPHFVIIRQVFEHIALDLANMPIGVDHFPVSHLTLHMYLSNSDNFPAKAPPKDGSATNCLAELRRKGFKK